MSQNNNLAQFSFKLNNIIFNNKDSSFQFIHSKGYNNIFQPLIKIETYNNIKLKNNNSIYINNVTIKNDYKNIYRENEYLDISNNKFKYLNENRNKNNYLNNISNSKKTGDISDFKTKWKTEKCHNWEMDGECKFGENCAFAHGDNELKKK